MSKEQVQFLTFTALANSGSVGSPSNWANYPATNNIEMTDHQIRWNGNLPSNTSVIDASSSGGFTLLNASYNDGSNIVYRISGGQGEWATASLSIDPANPQDIGFAPYSLTGSSLQLIGITGVSFNSWSTSAEQFTFVSTVNGSQVQASLGVSASSVLYTTTPLQADTLVNTPISNCIVRYADGDIGSNLGTSTPLLWATAQLPFPDVPADYTLWKGTKVLQPPTSNAPPIPISLICSYRTANGGWCITSEWENYIPVSLTIGASPLVLQLGGDQDQQINLTSTNGGSGNLWVSSDGGLYWNNNRIANA